MTTAKIEQLIEEKKWAAAYDSTLALIEQVGSSTMRASFVLACQSALSWHYSERTVTDGVKGPINELLPTLRAKESDNVFEPLTPSRFAAPPASVSTVTAPSGLKGLDEFLLQEHSVLTDIGPKLQVMLISAAEELYSHRDATFDELGDSLSLAATKINRGAETQPIIEGIKPILKEAVELVAQLQKPVGNAAIIAAALQSGSLERDILAAAECFGKEALREIKAILAKPGGAVSRINARNRIRELNEKK